MDALQALGRQPVAAGVSVARRTLVLAKPLKQAPTYVGQERKEFVFINN
jgi:hypothetical protein